MNRALTRIDTVVALEASHVKFPTSQTEVSKYVEVQGPALLDSFGMRFLSVKLRVSGFLHSGQVQERVWTCLEFGVSLSKQTSTGHSCHSLIIGLRPEMRMAKIIACLLNDSGARNGHGLADFGFDRRS